MEHAIHLSAKHVAEAIAPTPLSKLAHRIKAGLHSTTNIDALDEEVECILEASKDVQLNTEDADDHVLSYNEYQNSVGEKTTVLYYLLSYDEYQNYVVY
jgi:hypothetical protein